MNVRHPVSTAWRRRRRGVTLAEVLMSTFLLAGVTVAALAALRDVRDSQLETADVARAHELARELMAEIQAQYYDEQFEGSVFGPEPSEVSVPESRVHFDDVDDYEEWNKDEDLPVQDKDGTPLNLGPGWVRTADVQFVKANALNNDTGNDEGVKRAVVRVARNGKELAVQVGYMTRHWQPPPYD